ncbi:hypothetical protein QBZ16_002350 [Prototheca wickerhamii]|uniref:tRNA-5-taurinomethyluridine 2-sulfurtransferase n=1 Tax=Prototheca wickerhamii TaxID=3111 RepID=A0AAD9INA5_PROWI|nr:hypothetical protein QBZ16_002350 [Prototheca wickerhamii]
MWLEDILLGALESGVNGPTLVLLNLALLGCALCLVALLYSVGGTSPELALHLAIVLGLAIILAIAINWLVIQTGTVDAAAQREALLGEKKEVLEEANPEAASGSGPALQEEGEAEARAESEKERIAVGISGGVDSAVAALLLQRQGHELLGVFMRNWDEGEETGNRNCSVEEDARAAAGVCRALGIPFREVDFVADYWTRVFEDFLDQFGRGLTPNPDLACNRHIKFDALIRHAAALGCSATYFLASVQPESLRAARFPLGALTKPEVRRLAREAGLAAAAERRSSAGICFIGRRKFGDFLEQYLAPVPGRFRDLETGADLGPCPNLLALTVGQRAGLGGGPRRSYVAGKDALLRAPHWLDGGDAAERLRRDGALLGLYRARHGQQPLPCTVRPVSAARGFAPSALCRLSQADEAVDEGTFLVATFDEPATAITPQQAFVLYDGERCLGSALIARPGRTLAEERGEVALDADEESASSAAL